MYKTLVLIKKRNDLSMGDFISYYERSHAPLAERVIPGLRKYVRHFLRPYGNDVYQAGSEQPFHVATELWFDDEASFKAAMARLGEPSIASKVGADEAKLFDRSSITFMVVETHESQLAGMELTPATDR